MKDSISLIKAAEFYAAELAWCATELRQAVRVGSKAELEVELLYKCAIDTQNAVRMISTHMDIENLELKFKLSDKYGKKKKKKMRMIESRLWRSS